LKASVVLSPWFTRDRQAISNRFSRQRRTSRSHRRVARFISRRPCRASGVSTLRHRAAQSRAVFGQVVQKVGRLASCQQRGDQHACPSASTIDDSHSEWDRFWPVDHRWRVTVSQAEVAILRAPGAGTNHQYRLDCGMCGSLAGCECLYRCESGGRQSTKGWPWNWDPYGILVNGIAPGSTLDEGRNALLREGQVSTKSAAHALPMFPWGGPGTVDEIRRPSPVPWPIPKHLNERHILTMSLAAGTAATPAIFRLGR